MFDQSVKGHMGKKDNLRLTQQHACIVADLSSAVWGQQMKVFSLTSSAEFQLDYVDNAVVYVCSGTASQ